MSLVNRRVCPNFRIGIHSWFHGLPRKQRIACGFGKGVFHECFSSAPTDGYNLSHSGDQVTACLTYMM